MELDIKYGPQIDGVETKARQEFNHEQMIRSSFGQLDMHRSICELIDNGVDDGNQKIVITVNPHPNTAETPGLTIEYSGGKGMDLQALHKFLKWGNQQQEAGKIKQWGWGGKLALLHWLDKVNGTLVIKSSPKGSNETHTMTIKNWWKNLQRETDIYINTTRGQVNTTSTTTFDLININRDIVPNFKAALGLATQTGMTYGKHIESGNLKLVLRRFSNQGRKIDTFDVQPITPIFVENNDDFDYKTVKVKTSKGTVTLDLKWGHIDIEQKNKAARERQRVYKIVQEDEETTEKTETMPGGVYIYSYGRLLGILPLSKLKVTRTSLASLMNFAVTVNIVGGWVEQDLLKTQLSMSAKSTDAILNAVAKDVRSTIAEIAKRSDSSVSQKEKRYFKDLEEKFGNTLLKLFANKKEIAKLINDLAISESIANKEKNRQTTRSGHNAFTLPGTRISYSEKDKTVYESKESNRKVSIENPIPKFELRIDFANIYPPAEISVDENGNTVIAFNKKHPAVAKAAGQKNPNSSLLLIQYAARCLYHQSWVKNSQGDADVYATGMEQDVANLLKVFEA